MWSTEDNFVESLLSILLYVASVGGTWISRLVQQAPLPSEPSRQALSHFIIANSALYYEAIICDVSRALDTC